MMAMFAKLLDRLRRRIARTVAALDRRLMRPMSKSRFLSSIYYAIVNRSFAREHQAVLCGRLAFEASRSGPKSTSSLLRRNTHRLEKGLIMRPRRDVFALDYIGETMKFYESTRRASGSSSCVSPGELRWAHEVLSDYFAAVASHPTIDPLRDRFYALGPLDEGPQPQQRFVPYCRDLGVPPSVAYDDLLALAWRRRSVRWFRRDPVPRELVAKAVEVATLSPSACNRQPFYFHVFDDPAIIREVADLPGGTTGFSHQFPMVIAVIGELRNYYGERDRHIIYIDASLAVMSFVYAAETLGLATCCINWPDIEEDERRADKVLGLESDQRPIMFLAVGYPDPDGMVPFSQKKPVSQLCRFNFEETV